MTSNAHQDERLTKVEAILLKNNQDWDNYYIRREIAKETAEWISGLATWKNFLTLTFENATPYDTAYKKWKYLVKKLNEKQFGKNYIRKVGHSYFSYILAVEKQTRGVLHFHALINQPIDYKLVHSFWNEHCGFAWAEPTEDLKKVVDYCTKYIVKGGEIIPYLTKNKKEISIQISLMDLPKLPDIG